MGTKWRPRRHGDEVKAEDQCRWIYRGIWHQHFPSNKDHFLPLQPERRCIIGSYLTDCLLQPWASVCVCACSDNIEASERGIDWQARRKRNTRAHTVSNALRSTGSPFKPEGGSRGWKSRGWTRVWCVSVRSGWLLFFCFKSPGSEKLRWPWGSKHQSFTELPCYGIFLKLTYVFILTYVMLNIYKCFLSFMTWVFSKTWFVTWNSLNHLVPQ